VASPANPSHTPAPSGLRVLTWGPFGAALWDSARMAAVLAFLVPLFGGIAFGVASEFWGQMIPSAPPLLALPAVAPVGGTSSWDVSPPQPHRFALWFILMFVGHAGAKWLQFSTNAGHRKIAAHARRLTRKVSKHWFKLVAVNAILAFVTVTVLQVTQQFSPTRFLWSLVGSAVHAALSLVAGQVPGIDTGWAGRWAGWYQANQTKFLFWSLYSAAICDDLGLPNYKTLGVWLWRRMTGPREASTSGTERPESVVRAPRLAGLPDPVSRRERHRRRVMEGAVTAKGAPRRPADVPGACSGEDSPTTAWSNPVRSQRPNSTPAP